MYMCAPKVEKWLFVAEAMRGDSTELLWALVSIEDAQTVFKIMRLSAVTRVTFLLRILPPSTMR